MPLPPPRNVKTLSYYSCSPKTRADVAHALKSHYQGYITWPGIEEFISSLPLQLQQVVTLHYGELRTLLSIAEIMGCGKTTVCRYLATVKDIILEHTADPDPPW